MNKHIQMMNFSSSTYEKACSFPEISISTTIVFPSMKGIKNVDLDNLKRKLLDVVYESVSLDERSTAK